MRLPASKLPKQVEIDVLIVDLLRGVFVISVKNMKHLTIEDQKNDWFEKEKNYAKQVNDEAVFIRHLVNYPCQEADVRVEIPIHTVIWSVGEPPLDPIGMRR